MSVLLAAVAAASSTTLAQPAPGTLAPFAQPAPAMPVAPNSGAPGAGAVWSVGPAGRIDLGQPGVLSQRGQRLKIAVPYGSAPDARVSPASIWVAATSVPDGEVAPDAHGFTVMKPEHRNVVLLRSREPVTASRVTLTLRVAGQDDAPTYELAIPPVRFAPTEAAMPTEPAAVRRARPAARAGRRS